ncbi:hypothetical protein JOC85_000849 [Bacillus mesophilus]|uniref:Uncharacterized protein n=1 Tax=Bacillus mesophilus TaxID=1808955 RepID=A0A6M0QBU4_9BACI|nr:hypothetical protein [Bacillus mesophilus]MBM7660082.1 hypothetical protein [Bacillus mesophilus]NEY73737.1 hypothetical protein [Bacillus mesophilus]
MKINLVIFISSVLEQENQPNGQLMMKTYESSFRPVIGDILDDPGFHPGFHNGYEVVKVTINYAKEECYVSMQPLVLDREEIKLQTYIENLKAHGWHAVSKE